MIDAKIVKTMKAAAEEVAVESAMKYEILAGSEIMKGRRI